MRYELSPALPNKPRGVPRVNDRRVPNGIFWVLRSGAPCDQKEMAPTYGYGAV
jgi:transposase